MTMIFQRKPPIEGQYYFEVYGDSGKLLATSVFFSEGGHRLAAASCIIQDKRSSLARAAPSCLRARGCLRASGTPAWSRPTWVPVHLWRRRSGLARRASDHVMP